MLWCGCEIPVRCWKRCVWVGGWSPGPPRPQVPDLLCRFYSAPGSSSLSSIYSAIVFSSLSSPHGPTTMLHMGQQSHLLPPTVPLKAVHTLLLRALSPSSCLPLSVWLRGFQALSLSRPLCQALFPHEPGLLSPPCVRVPTVLVLWVISLGAL